MTRQSHTPRARGPLGFSCRHIVLAALIAALAVPSASASAQDAFIGLRIDAARNRVLLEIPESRLGQDFLYSNTLATGAGIYDLSLDRGQTGVTAIVRLERRGNRVLMVRDNWNVRAPGATEAEQRAASESFATSTLAAFPIQEAESTAGKVVVDASSFFLADVFDVIGKVRAAGQGTLRLDANRSWINEEASGSFPKNTEIGSVLTYVSDQPGGQLRVVAPEATAVTLEQHHTLMMLPDTTGFRPRRGDGRSGINYATFFDFSQGFDGTYRSSIASRWRLTPKDPQAYLRGELVEPVTPITYYLDPGTPEPYRTAFLEGGNWWSKIFEAAGFKNAFQLKLLPPGANMLDARYPMVLWVQRTAPAASVGASSRDPRTGEIVNAAARMDAYRSLVDYNIYAGLIPAAGRAGLPVSAEDFTMARRRQHVAHEIGHTLGLAHNYVAKSQGRASVMDYPFPQIDVDANGRFDLSKAFREGGGAWDSLAVRWAYSWFPDAKSEEAGLARIMNDAIKQGLRFITGNDAGPQGSIPEATWWVDGPNGMASLESTTRVRNLIVQRFDETAIQPGEPMSLLNQRFAQAYLYHRYALEGIVKYVGGMEFTYAMRGDGQTPTRILPAEDQRKALGMMLDALEPAALAIPDRINTLIPPAPFGTDGSEVVIRSAGGPAFDPITLAGGLATEVITNLLSRERAQRLVIFSSRDAKNPSLNEVLETVVQRTWGAPASTTPAHQVLRRAVERVVLNGMLDLASDAQATAEVRAVTAHQLSLLQTRLKSAAGGSPEDQALREMALRDLDKYFAGEDTPAARSRFPVVPLPWP
jgi:hypothetical protein